MRRMWAMSSHASALAMVFSQSLAMQRQRPSVDLARRRTGHTSLGLMCRRDEMAVQLLQQAVVAPHIEVAPHC